MVTFHSKYNGDKSIPSLCGVAFAPIKTKFGGPAQVLPESEEEDIIDEAIGYFRVQCLFKNFKVEGPADLLMIYMTCFIQKCLEVIVKDQNDQSKATKAVLALAMQEVPGVSSKGFFLGNLCTVVKSEEGKLSQYMKQIKQELSKRILNIIYNPEWGTLDMKFWLSYSKKKFLNMTFN